MYEFLPHTADIRLRVEAPDLESLFRDALRGVNDLVGPVSSASVVRRSVSIDAADPTSLLVDFLNEALLQLHVHRETFTTVEFASLTHERLEATLAGPIAESWLKDVKAVTYHEADVTFCNGRWSTILVLDI